MPWSMEQLQAEYTLWLDEFEINPHCDEVVVARRLDEILEAIHRLRREQGIK